MARTMRIFHTIAVAALILGLGAALAPAGAGQDHGPAPVDGASRWHSTEHARVRLIRGGTDEAGRDLAGLVIELDEGWHTYWRSPGALGLPPTFNWEGSTNIRGVNVEWPIPQHIVDGDYETFGYEDRVVLPLLVTREDAAVPAHLNLAIGYAVCETVCIPTLGFVAMTLPADDESAPPRNFVRHISEALDRVPAGDLAAAGLEVGQPRLEPRQDGRRLAFSVTSDHHLRDPLVILEGPKGMRFGRPELRLTRRGRHLEVSVPFDREADSVVPLGAAIAVTFAGGRMPATFTLGPIVAQEIQGAPSAPEDPQ